MTVRSAATRLPDMAARLLYSAWRTVVTKGSGSEAGVRVGKTGNFKTVVCNFVN